MRPGLLLAVALLVALALPALAQSGAPHAPDCSSALNTPAMNACYKAAW